MSVNEHPTTTDPDSVETRVAVAEKRRKLQRIAAGLGLYGAFGIAAFVGEAVAVVVKHVLRHVVGHAVRHALWHAVSGHCVREVDATLYRVVAYQI